MCLLRGREKEKVLSQWDVVTPQSPFLHFTIPLGFGAHMPMCPAHFLSLWGQDQAAQLAVWDLAPLTI